MKKVLILAYDFPPYVSVGGLRPYAWYQYLKDYGVYPIVVTRQWDNQYGNELDYVAPSKTNDTIIEETETGTIIRTPYKPNLANKILLKYGRTKYTLIRKLVTGWYEYMQYIFCIGPKSGLYYGAKHYLKNTQVDAIIATGEPFVLFKYASKLSTRFKTPWIADYRDPWSQNKNMRQHLFFEKTYTSNVKYAITVSNFFKNVINSVIHKPIYIIPNGYNPEKVTISDGIEQNSKKLAFAFTGTIYNWHPIESVLKEFDKFHQNEEHPEFEINFIGINKPEYIKQLVQDTSLRDIVHVYPKMLNVDLLKQLARQNVLLLFNDYSIMGTKIYDYLAIKRKILLCYSNDKDALQLKKQFFPFSDKQNHGENSHLQEDIILENHAGIIVEDATQMQTIIANIYHEFQQKGEISCNSTNIEQHSRKEQTKILASIIQNI